MSAVSWHTSLDPAAASREKAAHDEILEYALTKLTKRRLSRLPLATRAELATLLRIAVDDLENVDA